MRVILSRGKKAGIAVGVIIAVILLVIVTYFLLNTLRYRRHLNECNERDARREADRARQKIEFSKQIIRELRTDFDDHRLDSMSEQFNAEFYNKLSVEAQMAADKIWNVRRSSHGTGEGGTGEGGTGEGGTGTSGTGEGGAGTTGEGGTGTSGTGEGGAGTTGEGGTTGDTTDITVTGGTGTTGAGGTGDIGDDDINDPQFAIDARNIDLAFYKELNLESANEIEVKYEEGLQSWIEGREEAIQYELDIINDSSTDEGIIRYMNNREKIESEFKKFIEKREEYDQEYVTRRGSWIQALMRKEAVSEEWSVIDAGYIERKTSYTESLIDRRMKKSKELRESYIERYKLSQRKVDQRCKAYQTGERFPTVSEDSAKTGLGSSAFQEGNNEPIDPAVEYLLEIRRLESNAAYKLRTHKRKRDQELMDRRVESGCLEDQMSGIHVEERECQREFTEKAKVLMEGCRIKTEGNRLDFAAYKEESAKLNLAQGLAEKELKRKKESLAEKLKKSEASKESDLEEIGNNYDCFIRADECELKQKLDALKMAEDKRVSAEKVVKEEKAREKAEQHLQQQREEKRLIEENKKKEKEKMIDNIYQIVGGIDKDVKWEECKYRLYPVAGTDPDSADFRLGDRLGYVELVVELPPNDKQEIYTTTIGYLITGKILYYGIRGDLYDLVQHHTKGLVGNPYCLLTRSDLIQLLSNGVDNSYISNLSMSVANFWNSLNAAMVAMADMPVRGLKPLRLLREVVPYVLPFEAFCNLYESRFGAPKQLYAELYIRYRYIMAKNFESLHLSIASFQATSEIQIILKQDGLDPNNIFDILADANSSFGMDLDSAFTKGLYGNSNGGLKFSSAAQLSLDQRNGLGSAMPSEERFRIHKGIVCLDSDMSTSPTDTAFSEPSADDLSSSSSEYTTAEEEEVEKETEEEKGRDSRASPTAFSEPSADDLSSGHSTTEEEVKKGTEEEKG